MLAGAPMNASLLPRARIAAAVGCFAVWIAGWQIATAYAAARLDPASLGAPWVCVGGYPIYKPWDWFLWSRAFGSRAPRFFRVVSAYGYGAPIVALLLMAAIGRLRRRTESDAYGSARWETKSGLLTAGLGQTGVVLCQTAEARYRSESRVTPTGTQQRWALERMGELVADDSDLHCLCFAPTGSGKGAGLVVPTLLSWTHSVVAYDPKGELYAITAGWRRRFSHVIRFDPTARGSVRYNPLFCVPRGEGDVREAQNIAEVLVPKDERGKRDHWQLTAYKLLVGMILHVLYAEEDKSLGGVLKLLSDPHRTIREVLADMMATPHLGDRPHPQVVSAARAGLNKSDNELSGVVSTAETCLDLWLDPIIARNTAQSDFAPEQLNGLATPVSLYIVVPPNDIDRLRPLVRLMIVQIGNRLTAEVAAPPLPAAAESRPPIAARVLAAMRRVEPAPEPPSKQRLLFLIDEFPTLGYLPWLESAIAYLRGYRIKLFIIAQSLNQLEKFYGSHHAFIDNSWARITYTAYDDRTAKRISDLLGQRTEVRERVSRSKQRGAWFSESETRSDQEHGRALMTPGEILTLPSDEALLFAGGLHGYRGKKVMYYLDPRFQPRANLPTPDAPEEREAELPRPRPASEWTGLAPISVRIQQSPGAPAVAHLCVADELAEHHAPELGGDGVQWFGEEHTDDPDSAVGGELALQEHGS